MEKFEELEKLQNLKSNGIITEEEFEIEKHKILNNTSDNTKVKTGNKKSAIISIVLGLIMMAGGIFFVIDALL